MNKFKYSLLSLFIGLQVNPMAQSLEEVGRYNTGIYDESAAEIPAFDHSSKKLFVVNGGAKAIDVIDLSDPSSPAFLTNLDLSLVDANAKAANSVAVYNGLVAVAIENADKQANGWVALYNSSDYSLVKVLPAGALPDMLAFSKDGKILLAANEGEPSDDYTNDPEGSMTLITMADTTAHQISFESYNDSLTQLKAKGVRISAPGATVAEDLEPEYVTINDEGTMAWVSLQENNAVAMIDLENKLVQDIVGFGLKDFNQPGMGLDPIDNGEIKIQNYPLKGMYMPDAITSMSFNGQTFLFTANEGDGREYLVEHDLDEAACEKAGYDWDDECIEESWVDEGKLSKLELDSTKFTTEELALIDELPAKMLVVATEGDSNNDGKVEEIVMYGTRSFSVWNESGELVWDSGDQLEKLSAANNPDNFNTSNDKNELENRSRKKGPEPEGIVLGNIGDNTYAFVGLERFGGIAVFDVTLPMNPQFVEFFNDRDYSAETDSAKVLTQLGPEGLAFVPASESPNGENLLIVSYEVSGNTVVYKINERLAAQTDLYTWDSPTAYSEKEMFYFNETDSTLSDVTMIEGGWSDLVIDPFDKNSFWAVNDRGINVSHKNEGRNDKVFYDANYHQKLIKFSLEDGKWDVERQFEITSLNGEFTTGLPNPILPTGEVALQGNPGNPFVDTNNVIAPDSSGYDFEGIVFNVDSMMYLSDEYGPFITQVDPATMTIKKHYYPGNGLPEVLKSRRPNRGMEGLAVTPSGLLYGMMQSPLYNVNTEGVSGSDTKQKANLLRIVSLDPVSGETKQYGYLPDVKGGARKIGDIKIGAFTAINETEFIVIEHGKDISGRYWIDLVKVTIDETTTDLSAEGEKGMLIDEKTLEELAYDKSELLEHIVPVQREYLYTDLMGRTQWPHKKPEGITIIDSMHVAINNDNDYGMSDLDDDGVAHILPADEMLSQVMILTLDNPINHVAPDVGYSKLPEIVFARKQIQNAGFSFDGKYLKLPELNEVQNINIYKINGGLVRSFGTAKSTLNVTELFENEVGRFIIKVNNSNSTYSFGINNP